MANSDPPRRGRTARRSRLLLACFGLVLLALWSTPATAQQPSTATLMGSVNDETGSGLPDVAVSLEGGPDVATTRTVLSDQVGAFRFVAVSPGSYTLSARRIGYAVEDIGVELQPGESRSVSLTLDTDTLQLEGVVAEVSAANRERARFQTEPGVTARVVEGTTLRVLPGLGEADVLRAVQLLPGVVSTSDFSSSYNVRGGSADQNLILLDGFTIFNPFHLGGLFSVFNADAVERAELFAGGFGAEFGGRVSSVLNIESRGEAPEGMEASGGVSLLASRLLVRSRLPDAVGTALGGQAGSFFISGRRSYFDQLLRPVTEFPYYLGDVQAHAAIETANGGQVSITGYVGQDVLDLGQLGLSDSGDAADVLRLRWNWGNQVIGGRWTQPVGAGWMAESRLGFSRFSERLAFLDFGDVRFESGVDQIVWRGELAKDFPGATSLRIGLAADNLRYRNFAEAGGTTFIDAEGDGLLGGAYASLRWQPRRWIIEPGVRVDAWKTQTVVSPRFAVKRFFGASENMAVKFAAGRYSQFLQSLRDEELPVSNDNWVLADENIPAVVSDQVQLGFEAFWGTGWSASVELYGRTFDGVIEYNLAEDPNDPTDDLQAGDGWSYGVDTQLRRSEGSITGWLTLSFLKAERTFPDPLVASIDELPQTVSYPPIYDRRINFDAVAQYTTASDFEIGIRWNFGSGLPFTRPVAQHFSWWHDPVRGVAGPVAGVDEDDEDDEVDLPVTVVLGPRNAERYPSYHRLDLTVRRSFQRSWGSFVPYLQILNVYNRRNVLFYFYDYDRSPPVRSGFSMFPFLPAIGVEVTF
ncbi:MAG: TonB-dependent receptor plug domain-containing protein [Gemmatimonas sp.]|nr:TonB-dependent receptor plug domain-containing protein [Gemmatimonas sp.]